MMQPKRVKYRKPHRTRYEGHAKGHQQVWFGEWGLMALHGKNKPDYKGNWISDHQIEAARIVLAKAADKTKCGQIWTNIFPHLSRTKKPLEVRMGSGKGAPEIWCAVVKPGTVMFEIAGVPEADAKLALKRAGDKLNVKTKIVARDPSLPPVVLKERKKKIMDEIAEEQAELAAAASAGQQPAEQAATPAEGATPAAGAPAAEPAKEEKKEAK
ncbi:MAG: 50S ribosomal protein L16 [Mycoplasma sp.]|nr:50S ribosomal protein L16 [Candidatus Hennigella equi]